MIPKIDDVIAVAGWEERFAKGLRLDVTANVPTHVFLFVFEEYLNAQGGDLVDLFTVAGG